MTFPFPITEAVTHVILIFSSFTSAFLIAGLAAPHLIRMLENLKMGKQIRKKGPDGKDTKLFHALHHQKSGTPTMGGILIWGTTLFVVILSRMAAYFGWIDHSLINRKETYLPIFTLVTAALLGALDDYLNIKGFGETKGLRAKPKEFWLMLLSTLGALWFHFKLGYDQIHVPGIGDFEIGLWYIPLFIFILMATSNSVNITDGLDGLAGGLSIIAFSSFGAIAYMKGLLILATFCAVIVGASLAFLWFNIPPARFYMGDTGSLSLGATLGVIAMLTDSVLILPFIGAIFVIETGSVLLQLASKKWRGKKVFHIAPFHHHLEHIGWPEQQVTMRLWMLGSVFAVIGLILGLLGMGIQ